MPRHTDIIGIHHHKREETRRVRMGKTQECVEIYQVNEEDEAHLKRW